MTRDLACAALGWVIALATWIGARDLQRSLLSDEFGADGLPRGLAILLAVVSTFIALKAPIAWRARRRAAAGGGAGTTEDRERPVQHLRALGIAALGFGYLLATPWIGYAPAAAALILATALYYGARMSATLLGVAVAGAVFLWGLFAWVLGVPMPAGLWPRLLG